MTSTKTVRPINAVEITNAPTATPSDSRPDLLQRNQIPRGVRDLTSGSGMTDAMRTIVWVTGVAFGVFAPGTFAEGPIDARDMEKNPTFHRLDANHDGFVSRDEAKQNPAVAAVFDQADMNKDGKLDEDEYIKAASISQREALVKIAASESGLKSVLNNLTAK